MKITIVTPTYNSEKYIRECIESVKMQNFTNYEHIIVDGNSTDSTLDIVKEYKDKYPMIYISEADNGMYDAIAKGFQLGSGEIMCWLNSDDMFLHRGTLKIVNSIFEDNNVEWITGIPSAYESDGTNYGLPRTVYCYSNKYMKKGYYDGKALRFLQQESTFWKKSLWQKAQGDLIIQKYKMAGDYFLWKAFACFSNLCTVDCVLSGFRIHDGQKTSNLDQYYLEIGQMYSQNNILIKIIRFVDRVRNIFGRKAFIQYKKQK